MKPHLKTIIKGLLLSILVFFSVSFIMILPQLNPLSDTYGFNIKIGFPFVYYYQFWAGHDFLNWEWKIINLILDCLITWVAVTGIYYFIEKSN
ncbi:hypothetical protein Q763_05540 [Flavobacterium beibuense F44-8]|uniref:Uncharacterized protein n=1 Tax=Flavobacterium beibuense F44-8 TaxID=1406840 RepID=A0A0A2LTG7_9FLAO|nr:hypothetical protein [Flavobacterium beibuense]KGO82558.1 hypothetical protein Q763_05540 [Flavobacterium beibuense F44-8]